MAEAQQGSGISIRNLYKIFGHNAAAYVDLVKQGMSKAELNQKHGHVLGLKNINIEMPGGGIFVIMGLSGSGKSTLIRHINRLIDPTSGEVIVGGADVVKMNPRELQEFRRHKTAMVFQKFALLPHRNVLENTVYGLEIQGVPRATQVEQAMRWIERVGLARALTNDAPILLMDEAFSALDPLIRMDMQTVLLDLQKEIKKTIVFITHDLDEALRLGDRVAILRDGEVIQQGTAQDIVLQPADGYIANFVKEVNRGRVIKVNAIMPPANGDTPPSPVRACAEATLDEAATLLATAGQQQLSIVDQSGAQIGTVDLQRIVSAMVTPAAGEARA